MANVSIIEPIVSAEWINKHLYAKNLLVFDASIPKLVGDIILTKTQIPTTQFFDIKKTFSDVKGEFPNTIPSKKQFQEEARKLGINNDSAIVIYDDLGIYSSARAWWLFKTFGFENVAILNGGFPEWQKLNFNTENKQENKRPLGDFEAVFNSNNVVNFKDLEILSNDASTQIIDARSANRFSGKVAEPRKGLRSGTIPNSKKLTF